MNSHDSSNQQTTLLSTATEWLLYGLTFFIAFFFLPILGNPFDLPKLVAMVILSGVIALLWVAKAIRHKELLLTLGIPQLALLTILIVIALSSYVQKIFAINLIPNTFGVMGILILVTLFASEVLKKSSSTRFVRVSYVFGAVLTFIGLLQAVGFGISAIVNQLFSTSLPENFLFSPSGAPLVTLTFLLALMVPLAVTLFQEYEKKRSLSTHIFEVVVGVILLAGIVLHGYLFLSKQEFTPQIMPFSANWSITADTLKSGKQMILGSGPTRFADAYTTKRPVELNSTNHWNIVYQIGTNTPLSLSVSLGFIATVAWLLVGIYLLLQVPHSSAHAQPAGWLALGAIGSQLILPPNILILTLQFVSLAFYLSSEKHTPLHGKTSPVINFALKMIQRKNSEKQHTPASLLGVYVTAGVVIVSIFTLYSAMLTIVRAEYYFNQAGIAFRENKTNEGYEYQKKAVSTNPYHDGYHRSYAQTNLSLALALGSQKETTDEQKKTIAQLLQQAIRESRAAASINPTRSQNWRTMATVYRSLIGSTQDADKWAVAAYNQAIQTSPNDPSLRVDLGGLFYFAKNYEVASQLFEQSAVLKPDYANGYYNLARSRELEGKLQASVLAYQQVLRLVDQSSDDYVTAQKELSVLVEKAQAEQEKIAKNQPTTTPTPIPAQEENVATPKEVEIPEEAKEDVAVLEQEPENPQLATESATLVP